jgi:hypothetical protein
MVMRSFRISRLVVTMKSKAALLKLKDKVQKRYGHFLTLRIRGKTLYVTGEGIGNYKVRNWIYHIAEEN